MGGAGKSVKEFSWLSRQVRGFLMRIAPKTTIPTNDLFNSGYGGFVTIVIQCGFLFTFIFYSVVNTNENLNRNYLSPLHTNDPGMCTKVPIEISDYFIVDVNGNWESDELYQSSDAVYDLDFLNVHFENGDSDYKKLLLDFKEKLYNYTSRGLKRDFAWNAVFAVAYGGYNYDYGGVGNFYIDSEARIMFDQFVWSGGFSHAGGVCSPAGAEYYFDSGSFVMEVGGIDTSVPWNPCPSFLDPVHDFDFQADSLPLSYSFTIDSATLTTAIAVTQAMATMEDETIVESYSSDPLFNAYIDPYYAPMQPIHCIDAALIARTIGHVWPYPSDELCLLFIGNLVALPKVTSSGTYDDTCFTAKQCKCTDPRSEPGTGCNRMDITTAFIFVPYSVHQGNMTEAVLPLIQIMIRAFELNPSDPDIGLTDLTFPAMNTAYNANDWDRRGIYDQTMSSVYPNYDADTCPMTVAAGLNKTFTELCDGKCAILQFSQEASKANSYGARMNAGGYSYTNLSCSMEFYQPDLVDFMANHPPTNTLQLYRVCHSTLEMAFSDGISNAFSSAGLYSSILLVIVITAVMELHNCFNPDVPFLTPDETEIVVRNTLAEVVGTLVDSVGEGKKLTVEEALRAHDMLQNIQICDASLYAEYIDKKGEDLQCESIDTVGDDVDIEGQVKPKEYNSRMRKKAFGGVSMLHILKSRKAQKVTEKKRDRLSKQRSVAKQKSGALQLVALEDQLPQKTLSVEDIEDRLMQQLLHMVDKLTEKQAILLGTALKSRSVINGGLSKEAWEVARFDTY